MLQPDGALSEFTPASGEGDSGQGSWLYTTAAGDLCCMVCYRNQKPSRLPVPACSGPTLSLSVQASSALRVAPPLCLVMFQARWVSVGPNVPPHCFELPRPLVVTLVTLPQVAKQGAAALEVVTVTDPDTGATVMTRSDLVMVIQYPTDMHGNPLEGQQPVAGVPASYRALSETCCCMGMWSMHRAYLTGSNLRQE